MFGLLCVGCGSGSPGGERARPRFGLEPPQELTTPANDGVRGRGVEQVQEAAEREGSGRVGDGSVDLSERSEEASARSSPPDELTFVGDTSDGWQVFKTRGGLASFVPVGRSGDLYLSAEWLPDGTRAVVSYTAAVDDQDWESEDPDSGLFVVDSEGNELQRISGTGGWATWSPDGEQIAYADNGGEWLGDSGGFIVYVVNADGGGSPQEIGYGCCPEWSPNGTQIMYRFPTGPETWGLTVSELGGDSDWDIQVYPFPIDPDFGIPFGTQDGAWSPDGLKVAYTFGEEIHIVNADGTGVQSLIRADDTLHRPTWSPDGKRISYVSGEDDSWNGGEDRRQFWVADAEGGTSVLVSDAQLWGGEWSPDGTRLAYITGAGDSTGVIKVATLDALRVRDEVVVSPADSDSPVWSRDGTRIAFTSRGYPESNPEGDTEIFVADADGSNLIQITSNSHNDYGPEWIWGSQHPLPNPTAGFTSDSGRYGDLGGDDWLAVLRLAGNAEEACDVLVRIASRNIASRNNVDQDANVILRDILGGQRFVTTGISAEELGAIIFTLNLSLLTLIRECEANISLEAADVFRMLYWHRSLIFEIGYFLKEGENVSEVSSIATIGTWSTDEELRPFCKDEDTVAIGQQNPGWSDRLLSQKFIGLFEDAHLSNAGGMGELIALVAYLCGHNGENIGSGNFPQQYYTILSILEGQ